jgi:hypothetical protein
VAEVPLDAEAGAPAVGGAGAIVDGVVVVVAVPDELVAGGGVATGGLVVVGAGGVVVDFSGSVYWLSPAEGPVARAGAGATARIATAISTQVVVARRTLRVFQPIRAPARLLRPPP